MKKTSRTHTHPQRKHLVNEKKPYPKKRPKKDGDAPSTAHLSKKIRDTERLLKREEINAEVRIAAERQLRALKIDLQEAQFESREKKLAARYHRVKFFERQKVTRKIKQTEKLLKEADSKDKAEIERTLQELRLDLNYILHFPKSEKYIALFRKDDDENKVSTEKRNRIRENIRSLMHQGKLTDAQQIWRKEEKQNKSKKTPAVVDKSYEDLIQEDDFFAAPEPPTKSSKSTKKLSREMSEEAQDKGDDDDKDKEDDDDYEQTSEDSASESS